LKRTYPKNKPTKNGKNHGNLTKRTSELHEKAINSRKKIALTFVLKKNVGKSLMSEDLSKAIAEPGLHHKRYILERAPRIRAAHSFILFRLAVKWASPAWGPKN